MIPTLLVRGVEVRPSPYCPKRTPPPPFKHWLWRWFGSWLGFDEPIGGRWMAMIDGVIICHPETFAVIRDKLRERGVVQAP